MHARIARYGYSGDVHELARQAEEGIGPLYQEQPGFQAFSVAADGEELFSFTVWESADQAENASKVAAGWVQENLGDRMELREVKVGELLISTSLGVSTKAAV